ncbi:MAG: hypothetical protein ACJ8H8_30620, partial [Geminicoccaceae bacterium]
IARGTLPLALCGPADYGLRTGILTAPARVLQGGSPIVFGIVLDQAGPRAALLLSGGLTACSFLALLLLRRRRSGPNAGPLSLPPVPLVSSCQASAA